MVRACSPGPPTRAHHIKLEELRAEEGTVVVKLTQRDAVTGKIRKFLTPAPVTRLAVMKMIDVQQTKSRFDSSGRSIKPAVHYYLSPWTHARYKDRMPTPSPNNTLMPKIRRFACNLNDNRIYHFWRTVFFSTLCTAFGRLDALPGRIAPDTKKNTMKSKLKLHLASFFLIAQSTSFHSTNSSDLLLHWWVAERMHQERAPCTSPMR